MICYYEGLEKDRKKIKKVVEFVRPFIDPRDRVCIVLQNDTGYMFRIMKYDLSPNPVQEWCDVWVSHILKVTSGIVTRPLWSGPRC